MSRAAHTHQDVEEAEQRGRAEGRRAAMRLVAKSLASAGVEALAEKPVYQSDIDFSQNLAAAAAAFREQGAVRERARCLKLLEAGGLEAGPDLKAALENPHGDAGELAIKLLAARKDRDVQQRGLWLAALQGDEAVVGPLAPAPDAGGGEFSGSEPDPRIVAARARDLLDEAHARGRDLTLVEAVRHVRASMHLPATPKQIVPQDATALGGV